jgi:hypothetical protein
MHWTEWLCGYVVLSSAKFGFVTGAVTAMPVGIVAALVARVVIGWLRHLLEGWQRATIDGGLLGQLPVDVIRLLGLGQALGTVRRLDELPVVIVAAVFVCVVVLAGVLGAATASWWAVAYNAIAALSGGLTGAEPESGSGSCAEALGQDETRIAPSLPRAPSDG